MVVVEDLLQVVVVLLVVAQEEVVTETLDQAVHLQPVTEMAEVVLLEAQVVETMVQVDQVQEV
jgi:hypothetical protein